MLPGTQFSLVMGCAGERLQSVPFPTHMSGDHGLGILMPTADLRSLLRPVSQRGPTREIAGAEAQLTPTVARLIAG